MTIKHKLWRAFALIVLAFLIFYPIHSYYGHVLYSVLIAGVGGVLSADLVLTKIAKGADTRGEP